jgi:parallel beta-helix repeat protein
MFYKEHTMRTRFIRTAAILIGLVRLALGGADGVQASPGILYVAQGGSCNNLHPCYATVQAAVDASVTGDEIRVKTGTYTDRHDCPRNDITSGTVPAVVCLTKTVTIRGGYSSKFASRDPAAYPTTLDAASLGRVLYITGNISPTVDGLVLTHGSAAGLGGYDYYSTPMDVGGGVYIITASAILINNHITGSTTPFNGGGVYAGYSSSQLAGNTIDNNSAAYQGAGVFLSYAFSVVTGNLISHNIASDSGGGLYMEDTGATLTDNTISFNSASSRGGGMSAFLSSPTLTANIFRSNTSDWGGGAYLLFSTGNLTDNAFIDNNASGVGSELAITGSASALFHTTFARSVVGTVSGVFLANPGTSIVTSVSLTNTIFAREGAGINPDVGTQATMDGVLWFENGVNTAGSGDITVAHAYSGDPAFSPTDGYHLTAKSAAIDRGVSAGVQYDIDGQLRSFYPDLGADEYLGPGAPTYNFLPLLLLTP